MTGPEPDTGSASPGRKALAAFTFGLMFVALALVLGSGAGRHIYSDRDVDVGMLVAGGVAFAVAAAIGFAVRALRPDWRRTNAFGTAGNLALWGGLALAFVVGVGIDLAR